jgi:Transposase, Mutator family
MGMSGISKSQVSRLCAEIDDKVKAFLARPIEGDWPYLWIDESPDLALVPVNRGVTCDLGNVTPLGDGQGQILLLARMSSA